VRYVRIRLGVDDKRLDDILADGIRGQTLQENTVTKGRPASQPSKKVLMVFQTKTVNLSLFQMKQIQIPQMCTLSIE
jgi:hypothetical protein